MTARQMHLIGYLIAGPTWHNNGGWRHPESDADIPAEHFQAVAEIIAYVWKLGRPRGTG